MQESDDTKPGTSAPEEGTSTGLALRERDRELAREMTVALEPAKVLGVLQRPGATESRSVSSEHPLTHQYDRGTIFYERTEHGVVLWRRPARPWNRGQREYIPYPDMLEVSIEPTARGSRIRMHWRRHPVTRSSVRWTAAMASITGLLWIAAFLSGRVVEVLLIGGLGLVAVLVQASIRFAQLRQQRQSLLHHAYAALAPHELGPGELEASAFRAPRPPR